MKFELKKGAQQLNSVTQRYQVGCKMGAQAHAHISMNPEPTYIFRLQLGELGPLGLWVLDNQKTLSISKDDGLTGTLATVTTTVKNQ